VPIMSTLMNSKTALVIGLDSRGQSACRLLCRNGAKVFGLDGADTLELRKAAESLQAAGVEIALGASAIPAQEFDLAVVSPEKPANSALIESAVQRGLPLMSEIEFGFQQVKCLTIAIAGTNGKSTTGEMIERMLINNHRKTIFCGYQARPVCEMADQTKELDFLIAQADSFQLGATQRLQPAVAVLLNLAPDYLDRYPSPEDYTRANARLFRDQQTFDWAIIQSEALARMRALALPVPAKTITFSAADPEADLRLDRGLIISRVPNWSGPLLDSEHCQLRGPHNVENLMAALAVGHALRLPLEGMVDSLKTYTAGAHRFQLAAEINGVQFINDSKAANVDALHKALLAARPAPGGEPNIWLIAGGQEQDAEFHCLGPVLSRRVKRAFLIGETGERIRAAWGLFTPCTVVQSLIEAITEAAKNAVSGDVVLLSPACSSFGQFRDYQERGEIFCRAVQSISSGACWAYPNKNGKTLINERAATS
jgi:UDP-N-acetylmuramoylalanine--D-glutamate ligase